MNDLILSLASVNHKQEVMIYDLSGEIYYLQTEKLIEESIDKSVTHITVGEKYLYVTGYYSLKLYSLNSAMILEKEIILPKWCHGYNKQDYCDKTLLLSIKEEKLFVSDNKNFEIDVFDLEGHLLYSRNILEYKELFKQPQIIGEMYLFGKIKQVLEDGHGRNFLLISERNMTKKGGVVELDTGRIILSNLDEPDNAIFVNEMLIVLKNSKEITAYEYCPKTSFDMIEWSVGRTIWNMSLDEADNDMLSLTGLYAQDGFLFCGFASSNKMLINNNYDWGIFKISLKDGTIIEKTPMPLVRRLHNPHVLAITGIHNKFVPKLEKSFVQEQGQEQEQEIPDKNDDNIINDIDSSKPKEKNINNKMVFELDKKPNERRDYFERDHSKKIAIELDKVSLTYTRNAGFFFAFNKKLRKKFDFKALDSISCEVYEGDVIGLIGRNGAGKSTLSKVLTRVYEPDSGNIVVNGSVQLLSLGAGFRAELTGRENIYLNAALLGVSKQRADDLFDDIIGFSEIGNFLDEPIKTYSSGMRSRLAFGIATSIYPEILILDEVMSTGDGAFRKRASERLDELKNRVKSIIIISHNSNVIKTQCNRVIWLDKGRLIMQGESSMIMPIYDNFCLNPNKWLKDNHFT